MSDRRSRGQLVQHAKSFIEAAQHRAASALGVDELARTETVVAMLENNRRRAPGYWIQLALSMGIATLGLALGSTAVVIGAMLVSPLMGPILELGMGFAVGSALLVLRASIRVVLSVAVVTGGATILTLALPFHEITGEIASRTAPTALDLLVAVFCALTAAYTTVRPASDTTSAAAGTAIGIALVPPLCVTGFGLGTKSLTIAGGAGLLFTANLSAILVLAVLSFLALGYNQVDAATIERDFVDPEATRTGRMAERAQHRLRTLFGSKYGILMRVLVPAIFLGAVYVPLRRALDEVTWEVRTRDAIRRVLAVQAPAAVQTAINVEHHSVSLHLVLVGSDELASTIQEKIQAAVQRQTGVSPSVAVTAVPDAKTLASAARSVQVQPAGEENIDIATIRARLAAAIATEWPTATAGSLAGWELIVPSRSTPTIVVRHIGPAIGSNAEALLASRWSTRAGARLQVQDIPLDSNFIAARLGDERRWLASAEPMLDWVRAADRAVACVKAPIDSARSRTAEQRAALDKLRLSDAARLGRLVIADSTGWSMRAMVGNCPGSVGAAPPRSGGSAP